MKSATRVLISTFGGFASLMGVEHGIGEILQGSRAPDGLLILSWPESDFFRILSGEPAMTVIPNLLVTGVLAVIISLIYFAWATVLIRRKHSGLMLIMLSVFMLLVGGGIFPPILGLLIGAAATRLRPSQPAVRRPPLAGDQRPLLAGLRHFLSALWPWAFGACLASWLMMFPGVPALNYFFGLEDETFIFTVLGCMFGFLILSTIAGFARDSQGQAVSSTGI